MERRFNKETSVFKAWIEDTPQKTTATFEHDFNFWKLPRLIRENFETEVSLPKFLRILDTCLLTACVKACRLFKGVLHKLDKFKFLSSNN